MSEFNPTYEDLKNIDTKLIEIKQKKNKLVARKMKLQDSLSKYSEKYKAIDFNSSEFKSNKITRQSLKEQMSLVELDIKSFNEELAFKNKLRLEVVHFLKHSPKAKSDDVERMTKQLVGLKNKYQDFTKDRTRIASLRIMASEFISELEKIMK